VPLTPDEATLAVTGALMVGFYCARWRIAEREQDAANARVRAAGRAVWRARGVMIGVGLFAAALIDLWIRGKGH
jgi:hypothetical protein